LEHEIRRESVEVALDCLIEALGADPIKLRQIGIEDDLFVAEVVDQRSELLGHEQSPGGGGLLLKCGRFPFGRHEEVGEELLGTG
jgi:hypothetical protein